MNAYKKIIGVVFVILGSQNLHSLSLDSIQVRSSIGELLYAEIPFQYTDQDSPIHVSVANSHDLATLGIRHQPPQHLNFFIRPKNHETGIITITSSTPIYNHTLDFVIQIQNGQNKRLQHIQQSIYHPQISSSHRFQNHQEQILQPIHLVNELEIASQYIKKQQHQVHLEKHSIAEHVLIPLSKQAPNLENTWLASNHQILVNDQRSHKIMVNHANNLDKVLHVSLHSPPALNPEKTIVNSKENYNKDLDSTNQYDIKYAVQKNDNLWLISSKIAHKHQIPVSQVMKQIQLNNQHAFIRGNFNKLKNGTIITLKTTNMTEISANKNTNKQDKFQTNSSVFNTRTSSSKMLKNSNLTNNVSKINLIMN